MRPQFHFTAPRGWINDPYGVTFHEGAYHLFYQYIPESLGWRSDCRWGHATSPNLFDFDHLPIAIGTGDGDDGVWSGSVAAGTAFYTAISEPDIGRGRIRMATPTDGSWREWVKGAVVAAPPPALDVVAYRDPFVFRYGEGWRMLVGAALAGGTAAALSYSSIDATTWSYDGIAAERSRDLVEPVWTGSLWECPQLFPLDGRWVMVTSVWEADVLHHVAYALGSYDGQTFQPEAWGRLSYGPSYYAPSFFRDSWGAPALLFWLRGVGDAKAGWQGAHSVPHTLSLVGDTLVAAPHRALTAYRASVASPSVDIEWTGGTSIELNSVGQLLARVEVAPGSLTLAVLENEWAMPHDGGPVRIVADGPIVEISTASGLVAAPVPSTGGAVEARGDGQVALFGLAR